MVPFVAPSPLTGFASDDRQGATRRLKWSRAQKLDHPLGAVLF